MKLHEHYKRFTAHNCIATIASPFCEGGETLQFKLEGKERDFFMSTVSSAAKNKRSKKQIVINEPLTKLGFVGAYHQVGDPSRSRGDLIWVLKYRNMFVKGLGEEIALPALPVSTCSRGSSCPYCGISPYVHSGGFPGPPYPFPPPPFPLFHGGVPSPYFSGPTPSYLVGPEKCITDWK